MGFVTLPQARLARKSDVLSIATAAAPWAAVVALGLLEGSFGRTQYLGDWISYLNVSRAVSALDWRAIFNPMWNPGYPFLVALARGLAPPTAEGEWRAITLLNVLIFVGAFAAWRHLVRVAIAFCRPASAGMASHPVAVWTTTCLFLGCALGLQNASAVTPDLLVTTGFLLAAARTLSLIRRRSLWDAAALGLLLAAGVWVKGVFSAFALIFLLVVLLDCLIRRSGWRSLLTAAAVYGALYAGYVASISWSSGELTFGATGPLNYAFHVDHLPHYTNWQGGPAPLGSPIHPTRRLIPDQPAFEFGSPFTTTYPPHNNMAYWYQGFRLVHSLPLQFGALRLSAYYLAKIAQEHTIIPGVALALLVALVLPAWRRATLAAAKAGWPLFLPAALGVATYASVMVEDRYLGPFVLVLGLLPLAPLLEPGLVRRGALAAATVLILSVAALAELALADGDAFRAAFRGADYHDDPQWRLAAALSAHGLRQGDAVAVVRDAEAPYRVHWAYVSGLRIVAEFGGVPWSVDPRNRSRSDPGYSDPGDLDYGRVFWTQLTPDQRAAVLEAFRSTGARAVVSLERPERAPEPDWSDLIGATGLIYDFSNPGAQADNAGARR